MIKPRALKAGDTLGIIAPASPLKDRKMFLIKKRIEEMGFRPIIGKSCYASKGYLAGEDRLRAQDLNHMFLDKKVKGIMCIRGGYGAIRILEELDYDLIHKNPKVFIGYSDITAIHIAIHEKSNLVTFHGPMVASDMIPGIHPFSKKYFKKAMDSQISMGKICNPQNEKIECIAGGIGEGEIIGGNLAVLSSTIGTPFEINTKGKLLFLEEIGEKPYKIDRMLQQLKLAGKLEDAAGIILGDFNGCERENGKSSFTLMEVLKDHLHNLGKPVIYNLKAGHCIPNITIPFGVRAILDGNLGEVKIKECATIQ